MTTVVTHNSTFHADEVFAIALLKRAFPSEGFRIIRSRDPKVLEESKADDECFVIDVGGEFRQKYLNFDHHQDMSLPSSAGLIWDSYDYRIIGDDSLALEFFKEFVDAIDAIDTNRNNIYAKWRELPVGFRNVSSVIGSFNRDPKDDTLQYVQFLKALDFAEAIIENEIISAREKARSEREYADRQILDNNVAIFAQFSTVWKEKADHLFAVLPHATGWQIQSRDTSIDVVPERVKDFDGFVFRHGSGFMATFKEYSQVLDFAKTI